MSAAGFLEKLLDGAEVVWKPLEKVATIKHGRDWKHLNEGDIPVYGSGGIMGYVDEYSYDKPTVLIPRKGSITNIFYVETPLWNVDTIYYTEIDESQIVPKYLYYFLCTLNMMSMDTGSGRPSLTQAILNKIAVPIPCPDDPQKSLAIQGEIVRILDSFTELTAELTAELTQRKKQYNHYRDQLLTFDEDEVEWKALGDIATLRRGRVMSKGYLRDNAGVYPVYSSQTANNGMIGQIETFDFDGEYVSWTTDGANAGTVFYRNEKFSITNVCGVIKENGACPLDLKFLFFWLSTEAKKHVYSGMGNPKLMSHQVEKIPIPIPFPDDPKISLEAQKRIAAILDKFDTLTTSLTEGLPREIELRERQYAYYRDQLLSFPKPDAEAV